MDAITFIRQAVTQAHEQWMASRARSIHAFGDDVKPTGGWRLGGNVGKVVVTI